VDSDVIDQLLIRYYSLPQYSETVHKLYVGVKNELREKYCTTFCLNLMYP
jgi:hypothetical protein